MAKTILVVLVGTPEAGPADAYQVVQQEAAQAEAAREGVSGEVVLAPGFDHLRVIRKRLGEPGAPPVDAVVVEPSSLSGMGLILKELKGKTGLVILNAWSPEVEEHGRGWGTGLPFGTVSIDHRKIGQIQARQVAARLPREGHVLCVTGPLRSAAAAERLEGLKSGLPAGATLYEAEAGKWMESDGIVAFERWYALYKTRSFKVDVIAAHSDELAVGARRACEAVPSSAHRAMLLEARLLGVDACPAFGRKLVDTGRLSASVATPATTGEAIRRLQRFWKSGQPLPLKVLSEPTPYPPSSVAAG